MKIAPKVNKLGNILQAYAWINLIAGAVIALLQWMFVVDFSEAFAYFADVIIASFAILALGEIIQLLHNIYLNTSKDRVVEEELPDL